ncbi:exportin-6 [Coccinella septempunctata]|uniref:exportin-6 n=1 Tax=Coccinella septempunctata TaxID=41139 RepID=UPI001D079D1F|nr:exportin-6 [Coccinella septempunctata]
MDQNECMVALERLMDEFFNPTTSNGRKHEIEQEFQAFKSSPEAWMLCSHFVVHSSSHYVIMFSLTVLESVIHKLDNSHLRVRDEIRQILQNYLFNSGIHAPHYLREKYAKLLVDIAKEDWPHRYPEFIDLIMELLNISENRVLIGLILLRITSEEFTNSSFVDKDRKEELAISLETHIPTFFTVLARILESLDNKPRHTATATPPPSPTHSCIGIEPSGANFVAPLDPYAPDNRTLNREVLKTLQHLFTWVPIYTINSEIMKCVFNVMNISSYSQEDMDLCMLALSTINEILYRKCCPRGTEPVFVQLYHHTIDLLKDLSTSSIYQLESIDSTFVQKLSELIVLLIQQHFWKLEMYSNISTIDFLSLFYQLTVQLPSAQCYYQCLSTWAAFVKQIKQQNSHKYFEVLQGLLTMMLKKFQYTSNFEQLKGVNNCDVNEDNETEWGLFVKASNEIIALIADFAPVDTFNQVLIPWNAHHESYLTVMKELSKHSNLSSMCNSVEERDRLCCIVTDFSTLTQTLARLSSLFTDEKRDEVPNSMVEFIDGLFQKLLECASMANAAQLLGITLDQKVTDCLVMVHSELLASIRTWLFWMLQKERLNKQHLEVLVEITIMMLVKPESTPNSIGYSAACLLHSMSDLVPPQQILEFKPLLDFINRASSVRHPSPNIRQLIDESACNLLLSDCNKLKAGGEYMREFRTYRMFTYMDNLTKEFNLLTPTTEEEKIRRVSSNTLGSLTHIVDFCRKFSTQSKKTLYQCLQDTIKQSLRLFPMYVTYTEVSQDILTLFVKVLGVLQAQIGLEGTKEALDIILKVALQNVDMACIEKLLEIMKLVVEVPGSAYRTLLPSIVELCLQNLYQMVLNKSKENPEVYLALLKLLYSLLAHRWQYFHQSQVRAGFSPCVEGGVAGGPQKPHELITILEIFGQALLQEDINISKFSIGALEDLDQKWNLYMKDIFREHLLVKFLNVLVGALLNKAYSLLSEDVQIAIFHMADCNHQIFFDTFLPEFVCSLEGLTAPQRQELVKNFQREKDMPSFINQLKMFVRRAQTLTMCNS